jgi:hypothetical protein
MNSAVYQQSTIPASPKAFEIDPENKLLSRINPRRHDYETLRDSLLAVSGRMQPQIGGSPAHGNHQRRSIYTYIDRLDVPPVFTTFDFPSPSASCPQRTETTVAPQALFLMNNPFVAECAEAITQREEIKNKTSVSEKITSIYQLIYGRPPNSSDLTRLQNFLGNEPDPKTWAQFAQALVMANEFTFVD